MNSWPLKLAPAVMLLACAAPLFAMMESSWTSAMLFLAAALAIVLLASGQLPPIRAATRTQARLVVAALAAPTLVALAAAALRRDDYWPQFDAPVRLVLAIPVFLVVLRCRLDGTRTLRWVLPMALVAAAAYRLYFGQPERWPPNRFTISFVDPLVFGYLSLAYALMALMSVSLRREERSSPLDIALAAFTIVLGFFFCVLSESRSGWLAIPVVVALWLRFNVPSTRRLGAAGLPLLALLAAVVIGVTAYTFVPKVQQRIDETIDDVSSYSLDGRAPDSPVGLRITYLRIARDLVAQHPLAGVGDTAHAAPAPESQFPYATKFAVDYAFNSAFHNQIVTDAVRRGVAGGIAAALMLVMPLVVYARGLRSDDAGARHHAAIGIAWGACIFVSSFSTEVVDLKYTASLYAVMTAALCGGALARHGQD